MHMLVVVLTKALRNLLLPGILKVFLMCLLAYMAGWGILAWILSAVINHYIGADGVQGFWMHLMASFGGMIAAHFFFPLLYPILISFFDDRVANVIEHEDYPQLPPAVGPFWPTVLNDISFSLKAVGLNILILPFWIIPPLGITLYYGLNGYLLGTQFFRIVAGRRVTAAEATALQKKAHYSILLTGVAISFFSTVPVLNLAAPLVGIAAMLHLFHALRGTSKQEILPPH
jgi:CysZ protein